MRFAIGGHTFAQTRYLVCSFKMKRHTRTSAANAFVNRFVTGRRLLDTAEARLRVVFLFPLERPGCVDPALFLHA